MSVESTSDRLWLSTHCDTGKRHQLYSNGVCKWCWLHVPSLTYREPGSTPRSGNVRISRKRQSKKRAWKLEQIKSIYTRDGERCAYCDLQLLPFETVERLFIPAGNSLPSNYPTLDHVIPASKGGQWVLDNLVVSCPPCNQEKADNTIEPDSPPES